MTVNENNGMSRTELENQFKTIGDYIRDMKKILEKIDERQQKHYTELTEVKKDIEFIKKEIKDNKTDHKEEISILWNELRRRDKKTMWIVGTIISVGFLGMAVLKYFG